MGTTNSRKNALELDQKMIEGIQKHLMNQSFIIQGKPSTTQDVLNVYQGRVNTGQAIPMAQAAYRATLKADRDERSGTAGFARAFRDLVYGMFDSPDTLADFGLLPRKSTKKTVKVKAQAIAKSKATREARGTKGKKQKAQIHGQPQPEPQGTAPSGGTGAAPTASRPT